MAVRLDSLSEAGLSPHSEPSGSAHRVIRDFSRSEGGDVRGSAVVFLFAVDAHASLSPDSFNFLVHGGLSLKEKIISQTQLLCVHQLLYHFYDIKLLNL